VLQCVAVCCSMYDRSLLHNKVSIIGLCCKKDLNFKEPTNRSHPIAVLLIRYEVAVGFLK